MLEGEDRTADRDVAVGKGRDHAGERGAPPSAAGASRAARHPRRETPSAPPAPWAREARPELMGWAPRRRLKSRPKSRSSSRPTSRPSNKLSSKLSSRLSRCRKSRSSRAFIRGQPPRPRATQHSGPARIGDRWRRIHPPPAEPAPRRPDPLGEVGPEVPRDAHARRTNQPSRGVEPWCRAVKPSPIHHPGRHAPLGLESAAWPLERPGSPERDPWQDPGEDGQASGPLRSLLRRPRGRSPRGARGRSRAGSRRDARPGRAPPRGPAEGGPSLG